MADKTEFKLCMAPLSGRMFAGRVKRLDDDTVQRVGVRYDVTDDFNQCLIQLAARGGGDMRIDSSEGESWIVTVKKQAAGDSAPKEALQ